VADRVVQASLKLVLEPIFEADFYPCSYGFRPNRRAHDAVAEVRYLASRPRKYEWVLEGDIEACFDEINHTALMDRVRRRVGDKRVLGLVKAFLKAGILTQEQSLEETTAGTPQGGILSPLLANVALSVLDEFIARRPGGPASDANERARRLRHGRANFRLVRYADDWCLMIRGTQSDAEAFRNLSSQLRQLRSVHLGFGFGLVDPELGRHHRRVRSAAEPLRVDVVGGGEGVLPVLVDRVGGAEVDRGRGVPGDPGMPVDVVVLVEEAGAELAGVSQ